MEKYRERKTQEKANLETIKAIDHVHEILISNHDDNENVSTLENQNDDEQLQNSNGIPKQEYFCHEKFKSSDEDIRFCTGFPCSKALEHCFDFLNPGANGKNIIYWDSSTKIAENDIFNLQQSMNDKVKEEFCVKRGRPRKLDTMNEFFMFLCRIRQGFREHHLAHLFNVSIATVSRTVITWSNFVYLRLGSLNIWPDRETIDGNMPESIKKNSHQQGSS